MQKLPRGFLPACKPFQTQPLALDFQVLGVDGMTQDTCKAAATVFVDVEDLNRIRASLAEDGVKVIPAAGLAEAIQTPAPVILLDADHHQEWENALRHIVEMRPTARVVVLARKADNRMWVETLSQGAHDLLLKPLVSSEVRSAVLGALHSGRQREMHASAVSAG